MVRSQLLVFSMRAHGFNGCRCSRQGLNHSSLFERNHGKPVISPLRRKADRKEGSRDAGQRNAGESQGRPVTGRTGVATSLRRASGPTSSMVVRYEKTCRTFKRGKANERGFIHVCVLWQTSPKAASQYRKGGTAKPVRSAPLTRGFRTA